MVILLLIILVIVIGAKVVYKDNYAVLTGTIDFTVNTGNTSGTKNIDYPEGFNKDNCVVIALGIAGATSSNKEYCYGFSGDHAGSYVTGGIAKSLKLREGYMQLDAYIGVEAAANTRNYRIVLMKID